MPVNSFLRSESLVPGARGGPSDKGLKRQKKKGGQLPVDLVKVAKLASGEGLAELEVVFANP
jgi:hypothetical protein